MSSTKWYHGYRQRFRWYLCQCSDGGSSCCWGFTCMCFDYINIISW
ncbi:hypothetical protein W5O_03313 [Candida albicans Ca6]|nr:hypothetical protein W5O_03313 [Candida albicans Ca6]